MRDPNSVGEFDSFGLSPFVEDGNNNRHQPSHQAQPQTQSNDTIRKKAKRRRRALNCESCRASKLKCDRQMPCTSCVRKNKGDQCVYTPLADDKSPNNDERTSPPTIKGYRDAENFQSKKSESMKDRVSKMESFILGLLLEQNGRAAGAVDTSKLPHDRLRRQQASGDYELPNSIRGPSSSSSDSSSHTRQNIQNLGLLSGFPSAYSDIVRSPYEPNSSSSNTAVELDYDESESESMALLRESLGLLKLDSKGKSVYHGDTYWGYFLSEIVEIQDFFQKLRLEFDKHGFHEPICSEYSTDTPVSSFDSPAGSGDSPNSRSSTGTNPAPTQNSNGCITGANAMFGKGRHSVPEVKRNHMPVPSLFASLGFSGQQVLDLIPPREVCDILVNRYFDSFDVIYRMMHRPSFMKEYEEFWTNQAKTELVWVSMFLGMLCLGLQSLSPDQVPSIFAGKVVETWSSWVNGMEVCGAAGKLAIKPSLTNVRALVLWIMSQAIGSPTTEWTDRSWTSMGMVIRVAQSMGLHRDPKWFKLSPFEAESRRRLWVVLHAIDNFYSVIQGLPMSIREDENDVALPGNYDDADLTDLLDSSDPIPPQHSEEDFCDTSFSIWREKFKRILSAALSQSMNLSCRNDEKGRYNQVLALNSELDQLWMSLPSYYDVHDFSTVAKDDPALVFQRLLLKMDYLKILVVLHRPFVSLSTKNIRYAGSRNLMVKACTKLLFLQRWFFTDESTVELRSRFWWIAVQMCLPYFLHATMYLAVSSACPSITVMEAEQFREDVKTSMEVMDQVITSYPSDHRQLLIVRAVVSQLKEVSEIREKNNRFAASKGFRPLQAGQGPTEALKFDLDANDVNFNINSLDYMHCASAGQTPSSQSLGSDSIQPATEGGFTDPNVYAVADQKPSAQSQQLPPGNGFPDLDPTEFNLNRINSNANNLDPTAPFFNNNPQLFAGMVEEVPDVEWDEFMNSLNNGEAFDETTRILTEI